MEIRDKSAKKLWSKALKHIYENGEDIVDTRKRVSREILRLGLTLDNFSNIKEPVETLANFKKWLYPRNKEIESITLDSDLGKSYVYSYGERIFAYGRKKINQIDDYLIPLLKKNKSFRRGIVTLWDPERDQILEGNAVPGLVCIDFKLRKGKLEVIAIVRSNDIFIGWPANLLQLYTLGKYVCEKLNIELGSIGTFSTSAHIFKENFEEIKEIID